MMRLQERAHELIENITPICPNSNPGLFWEDYIVTIKSGEVVYWPFNCLTCDKIDCPYFSNFQKPKSSAQQIKYSA